MRDEEKVSKETRQKPKRAYRRPDLIVYGNIREITKNVANSSSMLDGGSGSMQKTH
jgi:hypothetical protein